MAANNEILFMFSSHVSAINIIYKNTTFQNFTQDSSILTPCFERMNFRIQRTTVSDDVTIFFALRNIKPANKNEN